MPSPGSIARVRRCAVACVALVAAGGCATSPNISESAVPAAPAPETGAFVVTLGSDTLAVERYTRTADRLSIDAVVTSPQTIRRTVSVDFAGGAPAQFNVATTRPGAAAPQPQSFMIRYAPDSATLEARLVPDSLQTRRFAAPPGTLPMMGNSYALLENLTMYARRSGGDSVTVPVSWLSLRPTAGTVTIKRLGADSMLIWNFPGEPMRARVDAQGRLLGLSGLNTTLKVIVQRVATADIDAITNRFATRPVGQLSARDSVRTTIGTAVVSINYGRPQKRGRTVYGGIVPWNQVWRTGANAATGFTTSADLVANGTTIPAGSYTLWTLPSPNGWKLIINRQTGQWGTEYDPARDLARIDLREERLSSPVETFTMNVEPVAGRGGVLSIAWDDRRFVLPFEVRQ